MVIVHRMIATELAALGYRPEIVKCDTVAGQQQNIVFFDYQVSTGRFRGQRYTVGLSTECEAVGYPEVPPHWIFVSPPILDTRDGNNHGVNNFADREWVALSRPPKAFWDRLATKSMKGYMEHLARVWKHI